MQTPLPAPTPPKPPQPPTGGAATPPVSPAQPAPVAPAPTAPATPPTSTLAPKPPVAPPAVPAAAPNPATIQKPLPTPAAPAQAPAPVPAAKPPTPPAPTTPSPAAPTSVPLAGPAPTAPAAPKVQPSTIPSPLAPAAAKPPAVPSAPPAPAAGGIPNLPPRPPMPTAPVPAPTPVAAAPAPSGLPPQPPRPPIGASLPPAPPAPPTGPKAPGLPPNPVPANAPGSTAPPKPAGVKKSPLRFLPIIVGVLALIGVIAFVAMRFLGLGGATPTPTDPGSEGTVPKNQTTLTYWGLWEPNAVMDQVLRDFEQANPGIKVEYVKQSHQDYRDRLQNAIAQGSGPDLFRFHASWTPMLRDDLAAVPSNVFTPDSFESTFYPVAAKQLTYSSQLRGVPLMYDGLALYYNEDMLKAANAQPPQTWSDLRILASNLTVKSGTTVQRGGLAIGNASNVEHFSDILALLMLQNGATLEDPTSDEAVQALIFYTDFAKKYQVWSDKLPSSTVAFARGDVAMMLAPSWRAHEIAAQNPELKFGIAPAPQLGSTKIAWASYWAEGVNNKSRNKEAAWKLISYMSSADVMKKLYGQQATVRKFGEIYSRQDLASELSSEPLVVPFLNDAAYADGWYMSSFTHDNGINDQIIKYYEDAINAVLSGTTPENALQTVAQGVSTVLRQYQAPSAASTRQAAPADAPSAGDSF